MRPVDRLMPARKAETITHCQSRTDAVLHDIAYPRPHQMRSGLGGRAGTLYQQRKSPRLAKSYHHDSLCGCDGTKGILFWLERMRLSSWISLCTHMGLDIQMCRKSLSCPGVQGPRLTLRLTPLRRPPWPGDAETLGRNSNR